MTETGVTAILFDTGNHPALRAPLQRRGIANRIKILSMLYETI